MEWIQFVTIFATLLAGFGFIYRELKGFEVQIRQDINAQSGRTDRLYEMFIELVKERK